MNATAPKTILHHIRWPQRLLAGLSAAAILTLQLVAPPETAEAGPSTSTASAGSVPPPSVSAIQNFQPDLFTGRATTSIPISVPPGRKGLQPGLALTYSSSARNSWVGVGWSLELGYIERNTKHGVPKYDATDTFLIAIHGVSSELVKIPDGTYRTKDEGLFLRIQDQGLSGWEVRDKSGTRYHFGQSPASQIENLGNTFRWCLDKIVDLHGNTVTFTYAKHTGQVYPSQIQYTAHETNSVQDLVPTNQVDFELEDRTLLEDQDRTFRSGFEVKTTKRLKAIHVKAKSGSLWQLVRRYDVEYTRSARSSRSLIERVTQFGADGITSLPPAMMSYPVAGPTYQLQASLPIVPKLAGDMDGNGITDLIRFDAATGVWKVALATPTAFATETTWRTGFGTSSHVPVLGDWDGNGMTDIAVIQNGHWMFNIACNKATAACPAPPMFIDSGISSLVNYGAGGIPLTGDFNGDGDTDVGFYAGTAGWQFALKTGGAFIPTSSLTLSWGTATASPLTGDFNGDGLTDIALFLGDHIDVRLATGTGWTSPATWVSSFTPGQPLASADRNGDGLTDVLYYNTNTGEVRVIHSEMVRFSPSVETVPPGFNVRTANTQLQVGDFNGDGLADPVAFDATTGAAELARSQGTAPDLLTSITNGLGGSTTLQYQPSTQCDNVCPVEHIQRLPFVIPLVNQTVVSDGLGNAVTTTYNYRFGRYEEESREFRGFGRVEMRDADLNVSITQFHQDGIMKGRPFRTEFRDAEGDLWTSTDQTWSDSEIAPGVHFVRLDQSDSTSCDGDLTCRTVRNRFMYDAEGNLTAAYEDGEVGVSDGERSSHTTYVSNPANWLLGKPSLIETRDAAGTVIAKRRFYYDGATSVSAVPVKGQLTKEEEWLNPGNQWLATTLTYDTYGNVKTVTDALNRTTTNDYDATSTYLTKITNALGHTRELTYDSRFGQVTSSIDQNAQTVSTQYDALGRVTKVIGPNDTAALPTVRYEYDPCLATSNCTPPIRATVHSRVQSGQATELTVHAFTDGLGRTIQTRSPAENPAKQIVTGTVEFNAKGQVIKQWVPFLDDTLAGYRPASLVSGFSSLAKVEYAYDPLGRTLSTIDPSGTTSASYDDWITTSTDANGHSTRRTSDAFGKLNKVEELNGGQTYTTMYQYDPLGNLLRVTDHAGNVTQIAYDSLGRKLSMNDPDMGTWTYAYDAVDNLTSQTDARGVVIGFTYDVLNRLTQKAYTIPTGSGISNPGGVTYTYDQVTAQNLHAKGKLTTITDGSGSSTFTYDNLGRLTKEAKAIAGDSSYTIQRSYDLLGRLVTLTYPTNEVAAYTYNGQGGIETVHLGTQSIISGMTYNAAGQITEIVYGNGVSTDYSYDPLTLRLDQLVSTGPGGMLQDFSYQFDPAGNVTSIQDAVHTGSQSFQYDALHRLTQAQGAYGVLNYAYDPLGNLTSKEGVAQFYGEGTAGPHAVTSTSSGLQLAYDPNGNMVSKTSNQSTLLAQTLKYDAENRLVEVVSAQEESIAVTFQPGWNFFSLPVIPANNSISQLFPSFAQDFDQVSRQAGANWEHFVGNPEFDQFSTLDYGTGYQIYCKAAGPVTITFAGKLPSSRLTKSLGTGWHLLGATTLSTETTASWLGGVSFTQVTNQAGAAVTQTTAGQAYWVSASTNSTFSPPLPKDPSLRFVYDGDGGKVKQTDATGTTILLGEIYEKAPDGVISSYLFAGSQRIAAKLSNGQLRFYHGDHLGSSNLITNATGQQVALTEHQPFGTVSRQEGLTAPHQFTGQRQQLDHGLILFPARAYDPELGHFIQADPTVQHPGDPQDLNRYSYCRNNPLSLIDPSGYGWFRKLIAAVVAIVVAVVVTVAVTIVTENPVLGVGGGIAAGLGTYQAIAGSGRAHSTLSPAIGSPSTTAPTSPTNQPQLGIPVSLGPPAFNETRVLPVLGVLALPSDPSDAVLWPTLLIGGGVYIAFKYGAPALKRALDSAVTNTQDSREMVEGFHTTSHGRANLALATGEFSQLRFNPDARAGAAVYVSTTLSDSRRQANRNEVSLRVQARVKVFSLPFTPSYGIGQAIGFGARLFGYEAISFPSSKEPSALNYAIYRRDLVKVIGRVE